MNIKTRIEKTLCLEMTMTEREAWVLRTHLASFKEKTKIVSVTDQETDELLTKLLISLHLELTKEGKEDEKATVDDDDLDLNFDDLCVEFDGPDLSMGPSADGRNAGSARTTSPKFPGASVAQLATESAFAKANAEANTESDVAGVPDFRASSTDANLRAAKLAKLANVCSGRCKDPVAKSWDKFSHGPVEPIWDKPRW